MKPVTYHELAFRELVDEADYYEGKSHGLGFRFMDDVERAVRKLSEQPRAGALVDDGPCRKWALDTFQFRVVYLELPDSIRIIAIAHTSRRPRYWSDRMGDQ